MADTTHNALAAAVRAMHEVVIPALDPEHPLAREQARLVAGLLDLVDARLDLVPDRDRFELRLLVRQAEDLLGPASELSAAIATELTALIARGDELLARPGAELGEIRALGARLAAVTSALVRTAADAEDHLRAQIEGIVLDRSQSWLDVQRAWFRPQGWEPNASDVPELRDALDVT